MYYNKWSLMTVSHKDVVSVIRDLSEGECKKFYQSLLMDYGDIHYSYENDEGKYVMYPSGWSPGNFNNSMKQMEIFAPEGVDVKRTTMEWGMEWPKFENIPKTDPRWIDVHKTIKEKEEYYKKFYNSIRSNC